MRSQGKPLDRSVGTQIHNLREQKLPGEPTVGKPVIDKLLEAQCGQIWELKTPGGSSHKGPPPHFCTSVPHSEYRKQSTHMFSRWRGKKNHFEYARAFCS